MSRPGEIWLAEINPRIGREEGCVAGFHLCSRLVNGYAYQLQN